MTGTNAAAAPLPPTGNTFDKYGSTNALEQRVIRGFFAALESFLDDVAPTRVLEIGVGEGIISKRLEERFPDCCVVGLDLPDELLADEWRNRGLSCVFGDAIRLPFSDATFDLILAIEVFEHIDQPDTALSEVARE
jgi:ubiquinone/menaquinone biosynthesis C-methylase UbiE